MSSRLLSIAAELSAPPSSPSVFRDVSLQAVVRGYGVVATAPTDFLDSYNVWFRTYGLWDYLEDLLSEDQLVGETIAVEITGGPHARLTAHNLHEVLRYL